GAVAMSLPLRTTLNLGATVDDPCPRCVVGVCSGGERNGQPCTVNGSSAVFGDEVSLDCPPTAETILDGHIVAAIPLTTGTLTRTLSAASPNCTAGGYQGFKCMCDTCDDAAATPCASDADCSPGGICGGLRCIGTGGNA